MKLLILGGTVFVGRHLVTTARDRGHHVTLFNRGESNPQLFPNVEEIHGDRELGHTALKGRAWDAVIDVCGYLPRIVRDSVNCLRKTVDHYTFVSSISAYKDLSIANQDETAPVGEIEDEMCEEITEKTYGPLKVLCERQVAAGYPGKSLIIRPGLIVGPHDPTDRFTYWPYRLAQGGEVLAPVSEKTRVQFIDVRDLALWTIKMVEDRAKGIFNATGPDYALSMGALFEAIADECNSTFDVTWVSESFLKDHQIEPYLQMPLWEPDEEPGLGTVCCQKAIGEGLRFRPLAETIGSTLGWARSRPSDHEWQAGLSPEEEKDLLTQWHRAV